MNQNIKRLIKYLIIVLVTTFIFVVFCFSPDILLNIRLFLIKYKPWKYLFNSSVTNEIYTEVILGAFLNCLAIIISILAFKSADAAKKIQEAQHKAKIIEESSKLVSFIKSSMTIIYDLSKSIGNESELHIDFVNNYANHLFADNKISKEDFDYINEFIKKVERIKNYYSIPDPNNKDKEINEFIKKYFDDSVGFNDRLKKLIDNLNKIKR